MTGSWCAQYPILPDQQLLDTVCSTNLSNQLHHFGVVESSISTDDQKAALSTFGYRQEDAGDERFAVVGLLEDGDLLPKS